MAYNHDHTRQRQQRRRSRQQFEQARKKKRLHHMGVGMSIAGIVAAIACGVLLILIQVSRQSPAPSVPVQIGPGSGKTVIRLSFGGDVNITDRTVAAGLYGENYDFSPVFRDIAPLFADADAAIANFEGNLCGSPYGTAGTRAPQPLVQALNNAGVDMLQVANSCSLNNGLLGMRQTIDAVRKAGMTPLGAFSSVEEAQNAKNFHLYNIRGIKVAFVAFTKGVGNLSVPAGNEQSINLLYKDYTSTYQEVDTEGISAVLQNIEKEKPDVTVALLHWGSEYSSQVSATQTQIVKLMQKEGVDAIIGTHSHYVQTTEFDRNKGTVVAYSLGDLLGDADKPGTNYSMILDLEITKDHANDETKITGMDCTPIYIATPENDGVPRIEILRIDAAMDYYEANGVGRVSEETYNAMKSAKNKVASRVTTK